MPKLIVQNMAHRQVEVAEGQTVFQALQTAGIDWMHACGAKGRCTTCRLTVKEGMPHFGALTANEIRYRDNGKLKQNERLMCQSTLHGNASGLVPEQTKLPHQKYSDQAKEIES